MSRQYYQAGMDHFRRLSKIDKKTPIFLVASDDPKWCKKHFNGSDVYFTETNGTKLSPEQDMAVLGNTMSTVIGDNIAQTFFWQSDVIIQLYLMEPTAFGQHI